MALRIGRLAQAVAGDQQALGDLLARLQGARDDVVLDRRVGDVVEVALRARTALARRASRASRPSPALSHRRRRAAGPWCRRWCRPAPRSGDDAAPLGADQGLHLHRLDRDDDVALVHPLALAAEHLDHHPRHRRADVAGVAFVGLGQRLAGGGRAPVGDAHRAGLPVELEEEGAGALAVGLALREVADDEGAAALDVDRDLLARLHAVEVDRRRQHAHVAVLPLRGDVIGEHLRVHQPRGELGIGNAARGLALGLLAPGGEVGRRQHRARPHRDRRAPLEDLLLQGAGEAAVGLAQLAGEERDHRFREGDLAVRARHLLGREPAGHHGEREVAHHLGGGRHLDDVAEHAVDLGVGAGDLGPVLVVDAERARLLAQVGVLAAGDLVVVDVRGAGAEVALEGAVGAAHLLPVGGDRHHRVRIDPGVAGRVAQRGGDGAEARLRGEPAHRIHRGIDRVDAGVHRSQHARGGGTAGVVGVEVDGDADLLPERRHQGARGGGLAQPRHVLDAEDVRAGGLELLGQRDVVAEVVLAASGGR